MKTPAPSAPRRAPAREAGEPDPVDLGFDPTALPSLADLVRLRAARQGTQPFVTFLADGDRDERRLDFAGLEARALAVAGALAARGVGPGDRVLIMLPTGLEFVETFFGLLLGGMVAVPVYPPARLDRLEHYLRTLAAISETAACRAAILDERLVPLVGKQLAGKTQIVVTDHELKAAAAPGTPYPVEPGSPAFLQFTSGTTSQPRGVVLLHQQLLAQLEAYARALRLAPGEVVVSWLPLYHDLGLIGKILAALYGAAPVVLLSPIDFLKDPMSWLRAISRHRAVHSAAPNFAYDLCVRRCPPERLRAEGIDLSSLENAGMGGEPVSWATVERFRDHFAPFGLRPEVLNPCYGLAENTLVATGHRRGEALRTVTVSARGLQRNLVVPPEGEDDRAVVVGNGRPFPGMAVRIAGDEGRDLGADAIGEIWVQSPSLAAGYMGDREATARTFVEQDGQRWLRTGDLGFVSGGDLYICGRSKDVLIVRGRNFHPQDLEQEAGGVAGVRTGNVVAFAAPKDGGEVAVIVAEVDPRAGRPAGEVRQAVIEAISSAFQLAPGEVLLLPRGSLPKTSSGKLQRGLVREAYLAGKLATFTPPGKLASRWLTLRLLAGEVGRRLRPRRAAAVAAPAAASEAELGAIDPRFAEALRAVGAKVEFTLTPGLRLDGLGLDSLERVELWLQLERLFQAKVSEADWSSSQTLGELQALLERHEGTAPEGGSAGAPADGSSLLVRELLAPAEASEAPFSRPWTAPAIFGTLTAISRTCWGWDIEGHEHFPPEGGVIVAGNHATYLDGAWLRNAVPPEVQARLVAYNWAGLPGFTRVFLEQMETIPIDPERSFREAIRAGIEALRAGKAVLIFPEGQRTHSGRMGAFRPGVGLLSLLAQAPIVPFSLHGAFEIYPRDRALPRFSATRRGKAERLRIRFGPPLAPPELEAARAWPQALEVTRRLRAAVEAQLVDGA